MIQYVVLLIAIAGALAADPIFWASSTNTWSVPAELSIHLHAEGSLSTEPTGSAPESDFVFGLDVPTVSLPPGAVVQSDMLFVSYDATVTNRSENIETVPIDSTQPYTPWIFRGGWFWGVMCPYVEGLCAYNQYNSSALYPPFPDQLSGVFQMAWFEGDGPGADSGYNAISDASITTDYALSVSAERFIQYSLPVPEPASAVVTGLGLLCLAVLCKRRTLQ
jgi:hypothetical protein